MTGPIGAAGPRLTGVPAAGAPVAVVRVGPVAEPTLEAALREALARTGLDLAQLLAGGADALVQRPPTDAAGLTDTLERARGALVRHAPQEMLAALDREWVGAARSPAGWYYRAAALALLGLPGEADRVLAGGLALHDHPSLAFARSVVRLAAGDLAGARAALAAATEALTRWTDPSPDGPVDRAGARQLLQAWEALLLARRGNVGAADAILARLAAEADGGGGVLAWLPLALGRVRLEQARHAVARQGESRGEPAVGANEAPGADAPPSWVPDAGAADGGAPTEGVTASPRTTRPFDAVDGALERIGARLRAVPADAGARAGVAEDVLRVLQALATGGALWDAAAPSRVHAARSVVSSALQALLEQRGATAAPAAAPGDAPRLSRLALDAALAGDAASGLALLPRVARTEGPLVAAALERLLMPPATPPPVTPEAAGPDAVRDTPLDPRGRDTDGARARDGQPLVLEPPVTPRDHLLGVPLRLGLVFLPVDPLRARPSRGAGLPPGVLLDGRLAEARDARAGRRDHDLRAGRPARPPAAWYRRGGLLLGLLLGAWWWLHC